MSVDVSSPDLEEVLEEYRSRALASVNEPRVHMIQGGLCNLLREARTIAEFVIVIDTFLNALRGSITGNDVIAHDDRRVYREARAALSDLQLEARDFMRQHHVGPYSYGR